MYISSSQKNKETHLNRMQGGKVRLARWWCINARDAKNLTDLSRLRE